MRYLLQISCQVEQREQVSPLACR